MQHWYKNAFVDATVLFELPYMQIWTVLSNRSYTGFDPELLTSQVRLRTPWTPDQTYRLWKPLNMKLDMCDANVQKHEFSNLKNEWTAYVRVSLRLESRSRKALEKQSLPLLCTLSTRFFFKQETVRHSCYMIWLIFT